MPPIAAEDHRRDPAWRDGLAAILDDVVGAPCPSGEARRCGSGQSDSADVEALADAFLRGSVPAARRRRSALHRGRAAGLFHPPGREPAGGSLRLLPQRGLCPCCGSTPVAGLVTASGKTPGTRYLHCSLCSTAWNHVRAVCITCGGRDRCRSRGSRATTARSRPRPATSATPTRRCCTRPGHGGGPVRRRPGNAGVGCSRGRGGLVAARTQSAPADAIAKLGGARPSSDASGGPVRSHRSSRKSAPR